MAMDLTARIRLRDEYSNGIQKAVRQTKMLQEAAGQTSSAVDRIGAAGGRSSTALQRMSVSAGKSLSDIVGRAAKTTAAISSIGIAAGAVAAGAGAFKLIKESLMGASDIEQNNVAMEHFIGLTQGAEKAKSATKEYVDYLTKNANLTPFETGDVMGAGRRLVNVTSGDIGMAKQLLTVSENMAALNPGKSLMDAVEALADMKTGEMERMKEFGFKVTAQDVAKAGGGTKGAMNIMLNDVAKVFDGGADKLSKTSLGMWSTITGTFKTGISQMGQGALQRLNPELERISKYLSDGGADKFFDAGADMMASATNGLIQGFGRVQRYIQTHFTDNPEFAKLTSFDSKVDFIFNDFKNSFKKWYDKDGKSAITSAASSITDTLTTALANSTPQLTQIGITLGGGIATGIARGFASGAKNIPVVGSIIRAGGDIYSGVSDLVKSYQDGGMSGLVDKYVSDVQRVNSTPLTDEFGNAFEPIAPWKQAQINGSHAGGLDYVPFNGYVAELHKGERVQTKAEADRQRSGGGGITVHIPKLADQLIVREDADIDRISHGIANAIMRLQGVKPDMQY